MRGEAEHSEDYQSKPRCGFGCIAHVTVRRRLIDPGLGGLSLRRWRGLCLSATRIPHGSERLQILDEISLLLRRETESTNPVVMCHHVRERGRAAVVEIGRVLP
jgi:hypothetical protein